MEQLQNKGAIDQIAGKLGVQSGQASSAVNAAIPAILAGLTKNTQKPEGAAALSGALEKDHDGTVLEDGSYFDSYHDKQGDNILGHVFGDKKPAVQSQVSALSGMDLAQGGELMKMLAPLVMGYLGKEKSSGGLDISSLSQILGGGGSGGGLQLPGGLGDILGGLTGGAGATSSSKAKSGGLGGILGGLFGKKKVARLHRYTSRMAIRQPRPQRQDFPASKYHGRRMSESEYLALPEEKPYLEYVDGVVLQKPMPNRAHVLLIEELIFAIGAYRRRHGGSSGPEGRVRMPDGGGFRIPDAAFWSPSRPHEDDSVPSLAIEVRSPGQALAELRRKCRAFRENGVDVCWLIDPSSRSVEVFEGDRDGEYLAPEATLETLVMPGFSLPLTELFAVLD